MPKFIELMTTENKKFIYVYYESLWDYTKPFTSIKLAPHAFMYIFVVLIYNRIYIECIYICLLLVYTEAFLPVVLWKYYDKS